MAEHGEGGSIGAGHVGESPRVAKPRTDATVSRDSLARRCDAGLELTEEQWEVVWRLTGWGGIAFMRFGRSDLP
jgi:hypothetical protein